MKKEYPLALILWIREDLKDALTGDPYDAREKIEDALDKLKSLEENLEPKGLEGESK